MSILDILADQRIAEAVAEGKLDNLPGKGKPLKIEEDNPHAPREMRALFRLLRQAGVVPGWVQQAKDLVALDLEIDKKQMSLLRMHAQFTEELVMIPSAALFARARQWHAESRAELLDLVKRRGHLFRSYDANAPVRANRAQAVDTDALMRAFDKQFPPF